MIQLGQCLQQLIATLADRYDKKTHFRFTKLDIRDGFWRLVVSDTDVWNFCYVLPQFNKVKNIEDIKAVVLNCLKMGWCESPPLLFVALKNSKRCY